MTNTTEQFDQQPKKTDFREILYQSTITGGLAGATEVLVDHPLWTLKTRFQNSDIPKQSKLTANPKVLYRGLVPNMLSMVPISALQVICAESTKAVIKKDNDDESMSDLIDLFASCLGGAFSANVSGPTELIMARQKEKQGFISTASNMVKQHGISSLTKGLLGTACRDSIFTGGYLFGVPYLKNKLKPYTSDQVATVVSGVGAGVSAAVLSHPFDTVKTAQQTAPNAFESKSMTSMWNMAKTILKKDGIKGFYKGGVPRTVRVVSAVTLMGNVNETIGTWLGSKKP